MIAHHLRRAGGAGAARYEEAGRLFVGQPHGLRDARHLHRSTSHGLYGAMIVMLAHGLNTGALFLLRRRDLRAGAHAPDQRLRRAGDAYAGLCGALLASSCSRRSACPACRASSASFWSCWARSQTIPLGGARSPCRWSIFAAWYMMWMFQRVVFGRARANCPIRTMLRSTAADAPCWREPAVARTRCRRFQAAQAMSHADKSMRTRVRASRARARMRSSMAAGAEHGAPLWPDLTPKRWRRSCRCWS